MFERLATGWELAKQSLNVIRLDKELLLFPVLSGIACLLVLASFAGPLFLTEGGQNLIASMDRESPQAYIIGFLYYFINFFVIVFFNTALVGCALIRFRGGDPTVKDGLAIAFARLPQIVGWALLSATVGFILRLIESKSDKVGRFVSALLGMAWTVVSYFVVPVLVVEKLGPFAALKRSASVLKKSWGESLGAEFGTGILIFLLSLVAILPGAIGFLIGGQIAIATGIVISAILLILVALISSALNAIVVGALYLYAAEGTVAAQFDERLLGSAFRRR